MRSWERAFFPWWSTVVLSGGNTYMTATSSEIAYHCQHLLNPRLSLPWASEVQRPHCSSEEEQTGWKETIVSPFPLGLLQCFWKHFKLSVDYFSSSLESNNKALGKVLKGKDRMFSVTMAVLGRKICFWLTCQEST